MPELKTTTESAPVPIGTYSVFAVLLPGFFILSVDRVIRNALDFFDTIPWWFIMVALGCNIAAAIVLGILSLNRDGLASFIRVTFFIYAPALGLPALFLYKTPQLIAFAGGLLLLQWIVAHYIFRRFRDYVEFLGFIRKYHTDGNLNEGMHKVALLLKASRKSLQSLRKTVYFMQFLVFSTATALLVAGIPLHLLSLAACTGFILSGLVFGFLIGIYLDEYRFYIDGVYIQQDLKQKRWAYTILIILVCLLLIIPLARNTSVFPPGYMVSAFNWLLVKGFSLFKFDFELPRQLRRAAETRAPTENTPGGGDQAVPLYTNIGQILQIIGIVIAGLLFIGVLYFLLKPLFAKGFADLFKNKHPFRLLWKKLKQLAFLLKRTLHEIIRAILSFFAPTRKDDKTVTDRNSSSGYKNQGRQSFKKRRQKNKVLKAFFILIRWGRRHNIFFHPALGPGEYISLVIENRPGQEDKLVFIGETFEEAVFSDHIMPPAVIREYIHGIKEIISG